MVRTIRDVCQDPLDESVPLDRRLTSLTLFIFLFLSPTPHLASNSEPAVALGRHRGRIAKPLSATNQG